ncbi:MAG: hypothetical protein ACRDCT_00950 [Shewanella sp.]|uniref:hypothetical protein n=1 Tax=Vibrio misgurnus TaxID=2993714 RepID=UPI0024172079|nr:hypothetical protein [Vibrio sp. gvc]
MFNFTNWVKLGKIFSHLDHLSVAKNAEFSAEGQSITEHSIHTVDKLCSGLDHAWQTALIIDTTSR